MLGGMRYLRNGVRVRGPRGQADRPGTRCPYERRFGRDKEIRGSDTGSSHS